MQRKRAFIFDLDGVIIDSGPVHVQAWSIYLKNLGISADRLKERMHGRHNNDIVRDLVGAALGEREVRRHGAAKEAIYRDLMGPQLRARLVPGIRRFLRRRREAPLAVASNAEPANVDFVLDGARLRRFFGVVIDGHQVQRPKPDPEVYLLAAERLGVSPPDCVVFEDSEPGVAAARAAGASIVGVETGGGKLAGVALAIRDFRAPELEAWLAEGGLC